MKITLKLEALSIEDEMKVELALRAQDLQMALKEIVALVKTTANGSKVLAEQVTNIVENLELKHLL